MSTHASTQVASGRVGSRPVAVQRNSRQAGIHEGVDCNHRQDVREVVLQVG